jgi:hypothetical protein
MTAYTGRTNAAIIVNVLIKEILPWYRIEFIDMSQSTTVLKISEVLMRCRLNKANVPYLVLTEKNLKIDHVNLVEHLNGVLSGKVRDDAGNLVANGES